MGISQELRRRNVVRFCAHSEIAATALLVPVAQAANHAPERSAELSGRMAELAEIDLGYRNSAARAVRLAALPEKSE